MFALDFNCTVLGRFRIDLVIVRGNSEKVNAPAHSPTGFDSAAAPQESFFRMETAGSVKPLEFLTFALDFGFPVLGRFKSDHAVVRGNSSPFFQPFSHIFRFRTCNELPDMI